MGYSDDMAKTRDALYALGSEAVKVLEKAMKDSSSVSALEANIAGQILDRIGFERKGVKAD